ncbi:MAG TPA: hypothetical protein VHC63_18565 [Acidimicrobiales bacterium]|nr:hypothetical protein [Acidimicrobiales bacterium]
MQLRSATFLRAFAVWTIFVWVVFIRNVFKHGGVAFIAVHLVLAVISLAFAAGTFAVVRRERHT